MDQNPPTGRQFTVRECREASEANTAEIERAVEEGKRRARETLLTHQS